jgi:hypothetical protein
MRQNGIRVAAPVNAEPRWPAGYIEVLREAGAQEKTIPHCLGWVRRSVAAHPGRSRRELGRQELDAFLGSLAAEPGVTNWHVQQARDALDLQCEQFRVIIPGLRLDSPACHGVVPAGYVQPQGPASLRVVDSKASFRSGSALMRG